MSGHALQLDVELTALPNLLFIYKTVFIKGFSILEHKVNVKGNVITASPEKLRIHHFRGLNYNPETLMSGPRGWKTLSIMLYNKPEEDGSHIRYL